MKLIFYSGGHAEQNIDLDAHLLKMLGQVNPRITFVPSCYEHTDEDYNDFEEHLSQHGLSANRVLHLDRALAESEIYSALDADMVYLSGGNTFYFLNSLRKSKAMNILRTFAREDRIIVGKSAGAILMTPDINTAGFPEFDRDENPDNIKNLKALGLVNFDFFPHYKNRKAYDQEFLNYTMTTNRPLYASADGCGIAIHNNQTTFVGETACFANGRKFWIR